MKWIYLFMEAIIAITVVAVIVVPLVKLLQYLAR